MVKIRFICIGLFLMLPLFTQGQDMQELLDLTYDKTIIDTLKTKDSLALTAKDHFQWGMFEVAQGHYGKALVYFEKAKKLDGENINNRELIYFMGKCEAGLHNFQKSSIYFEELLKNGISATILILTPETSLERYRYYKPLIVTYGLHFGFWDYIFLLVSILGFALSLFFMYYFNKKNRSAIYIGLFIMAFSVNILEYVLYWTNYILYSPLRGMYLVLFFLYPPLLYLYIKKNIDLGKNTTPFDNKDHLHFLFFYFTLLLLIIYHAFSDKNHDYLSQTVVLILQNSWLKMVYVAVYLVLISMVIKGKLHSLNLYLRRWLILLVVFYLFMVLSYFLPSIANRYGLLNKELEYYFSLMYSLFVFMCGVMVIVQPEVFLGSSLTNSLKDSIKYKNSSLTESLSKELRDKLEDLLEKDKIYLQSELNLEKLANQLNIDRYSMSQVINEGFGKGFYELINEYRIEAAKKLLWDTDKRVGDIILEVGFNNHMSFYKAFKKFTKTTPSQFIEKYRNRA